MYIYLWDCISKKNHTFSAFFYCLQYFNFKGKLIYNLSNYIGINMNA